ncbi:hypothetical protein RHSIM_Rhsim06G0117000 [Rhododendron simsii]|uniref:Xyloglucan endo-transglycosylase C-terminal domain-containing protein n=1 Tax=Rhododendron simsii TaxID=118357 RepID=A0A834GTM3_RHOSS|nr:hypothetical protein RHSIM_Rhsim06G0117000 [Rhododendron simsii]
MLGSKEEKPKCEKRKNSMKITFAASLVRTTKSLVWTSNRSAEQNQATSMSSPDQTYGSPDKRLWNAIVLMAILMAASAENFYRDVEITFGDELTVILNGGDKLEACVYSSGSSSCGSSQSTTSTTSTEAWLTQSLDSKDLEKLLWVQQNCMIYDYCTDYERFPQGLPPEYNHPRFQQ